MDKVNLNVRSFFQDGLIINPARAATKSQQIVATIISIAIGIFSLAIVHAVVFIHRKFCHKIQKSDLDQKIDRNAVVTLKVSSTPVSTDDSNHSILANVNNPSIISPVEASALNKIIDCSIEDKGKRTFGSDVYEGDLKYSEPHGIGKMIYSNGDIYEGGWQWGKRFGMGKMTYANGDVYEGGWADEKKNGKGKMIKQNKEVLEGYWLFDNYQHGTRRLETLARQNKLGE